MFSSSICRPHTHWGEALKVLKTFRVYEVVEKVAETRRTVIPAWLHSSGVDGGNPLPAYRQAGMPRFSCHCEKSRSGDEAISYLPSGIDSLPTIARNDKTAKCSDFQIDTRLDSGFRFAVLE